MALSQATGWADIYSMCVLSEIQAERAAATYGKCFQCMSPEHREWIETSKVLKALAWNWPTVHFISLGKSLGQT